MASIWTLCGEYTHVPTLESPMSLNIAYLSRGKLYLHAADGSDREIASPFAQDAVNRALRSQERHGWKNAGGDEGSPFSQVLWGSRGEDPDRMPIAFTGVSGGAGGAELFYILNTGAVAGLFRYDLAGDAEKRLFHTTNFNGADLSREPGDGRIACAIYHSGGTANIGLMEPDGTHLRQITEGDSLDEAPSWVPNQPDRLLFQSSGAGRNAQGVMVLRGPAAIESMDLNSRRVDTLISNDDFDYLLPRFGADGNIYCIRRPYEGGRPRYGFLQFLKDVVFFPFRLVRAVFHFLNAFSMMFSGKPLTTAGNQQKEIADLGSLYLRGRLIDTEKALATFHDGESPALVPADWQLLRLKASGGSEVLARHVVAYDMLPDGELVYSNGSSVFKLSADGKRTTLFAGKCIETLAVLS